MHAFRTLATVALLPGALLMLPGTVGGSTNYVKTYGTSMEPTFQAGDLAVLRGSRNYGVGDIAAYRSPELDRVVLHRIVERQGADLIFQGDNNDFRDRERIADADVLGRLALRVPRGGAALTWLQTPLHAAAVAAVLCLLPLLRATRRRRRLSSTPEPIRGPPMNPFPVIQLQRATPWLAASALASLVAGALILASPAAGDPSERGQLTHTGSFSYSAPSSSSLYPHGFGKGDPVFTRLSDEVTVEFVHEAETGLEMDTRGTVRIDALLSGSGGWQRTIPLAGPQPLEEGPTTVAAVLRLRTLQSLADEAATVTGTPSGPFRIDVAPIVEFAGTVGGHRVDDRFAPTLAFSLDAAALRLTSPADGSASSFLQTRDVPLGRPNPAAARSMGLLTRLPLPASGAPAFLGGGLLMALAAAWAHRQVRQSGGPGPVALRYAHLLVPVKSVTRDAARPVVQIASMADLVRLAKHHDQLVLHEAREGRHSYMCELGGATYVFRPAG